MGDDVQPLLDSGYGKWKPPSVRAVERVAEMREQRWYLLRERCSMVTRSVMVLACAGEWTTEED